jgi:hypothetical protein
LGDVLLALVPHESVSLYAISLAFTSESITFHKRRASDAGALILDALVGDAPLLDETGIAFGLAPLALLHGALDAPAEALTVLDEKLDEVRDVLPAAFLGDAGLEVGGGDGALDALEDAAGLGALLGGGLDDGLGVAGGNDAGARVLDALALVGEEALLAVEEALAVLVLEPVAVRGEGEALAHVGDARALVDVEAGNAARLALAGLNKDLAVRGARKAVAGAPGGNLVAGLGLGVGDEALVAEHLAALLGGAAHGVGGAGHARAKVSGGLGSGSGLRGGRGRVALVVLEDIAGLAGGKARVIARLANRVLGAHDAIAW